MINKIRHLAIQRKLLLILLFSSFSSLIFAGLFLMILEISELKKNVHEDLIAVAKMVGNRSTAALMFEDYALASENLAVFDGYPIIQTACLYNSSGAVFAQFYKHDVSRQYSCPPSLTFEQTEFVQLHFYVLEPVISDSIQIGKVLLYANLNHVYFQKIKFTILIFCVLTIVSALSFLLSKPLLRLISDPLKHLADTVKNITDTRDYSLRAVKLNNDELGDLVDVLNNLINTVEVQNQALMSAKDRFQVLFDDNPTMIFNLTEQSQILSVNATGATELGFEIAEMQGVNIYNFIHIDDVANLQVLFEFCLSNPLLIYKQEIRLICRDNHHIWVRATARLVESENQPNSLLLVCEDVTEMHFLNEKIAYQASYDELTGLINRNQFDINCKQIASLARINHTEHALCYLDIDQFKVINDTCGHLAGDELLRQLGELLTKHLRHDDYVSRLGGDEFGILMNNCTLNQAALACDKLLEKIRRFPFVWEARSFSISASIGITVINNKISNTHYSLKEADTACYIAKDKGRNRIHIYRYDDKELTLRQGEMEWVERIQQGLEQNRFCLYGQPIVSISGSDEGLHFETLLRYRDSSGRIIAPGEFLPSAERYNLASAIDRWVVKNLFEWIANNPEFLDALSICSVNLSGRSLSDDGLLEFVTEQFALWNIPAHKICFEITETAAIDNMVGATVFIEGLRSQGCLFSLDDFGSGLSSFAYLKNFPVDFLKIDGVFVKDILNDQFDFAMVKSITEVGHVMSKKTVAEFVENTQILDLLRELGVDYAQGYGIGRPVPLDDLIFKPSHAELAV